MFLRRKFLWRSPRVPFGLLADYRPKWPFPSICLFVCYCVGAPSSTARLGGGGRRMEKKGRGWGRGRGGEGAVVADEWPRPAFPFTHLDRFQATTTHQGKEEREWNCPLPSPSLAGLLDTCQPRCWERRASPQMQQSSSWANGWREKEGRGGNGLGLCEEEKTMRREEGVRGKMRATGRREEKAGREGRPIYFALRHGTTNNGTIKVELNIVDDSC